MKEQKAVQNVPESKNSEVSRVLTNGEFKGGESKIFSKMIYPIKKGIQDSKTITLPSNINTDSILEVSQYLVGLGYDSYHIKIIAPTTFRVNK